MRPSRNHLLGNNVLLRGGRVESRKEDSTGKDEGEWMMGGQPTTLMRVEGKFYERKKN